MRLHRTRRDWLRESLRPWLIPQIPRQPKSRSDHAELPTNKQMMGQLCERGSNLEPRCKINKTNHLQGKHRAFDGPQNAIRRKLFKRLHNFEHESAVLKLSEDLLPPVFMSSIEKLNRLLVRIQLRKFYGSVIG